jgi:hypothetical protein
VSCHATSALWRRAHWQSQLSRKAGKFRVLSSWSAPVDSLEG